MTETREESANRFLNLIQDRKRGRFKLYIGMAAGVGKTYRMLQEAHDLYNRGVDVIVGVVVTHNRTDTVNRAHGLPLLPLKQVFYRGKALEEFDLEVALLRRPEVVIVDELAHTNVPGSTHEKRWQDVQTLLAAGINVISAVNIQHVESLNPTVQQITGVEVTERIPDRMLALADEVVNIDLTADELILRLREGKIYEQSKVESALQNFFRADNLLQLRELALREVANSLEKRIDATVAPDQRPTPQRICVCISTNEKTGKHLIRRTARLADTYCSTWYVVYIQTEREMPDKINLASQRHLINNFKLATELGACVLTIQGNDIALALVDFAKQNNISMLVMGKTRRTRWQNLWRGDIMRDLIRLTEYTNVDILIIS
jgi:two-component system sensor histidine kinase KdpD